MANVNRHSAAFGWVGVGCLAFYWAAAFVPPVADALPDSSFGKFIVLGIFLAGTPLTVIAAIRGSRWWWVTVAAGVLTLWEVYARFFRLRT